MGKKLLIFISSISVLIIISTFAASALIAHLLTGESTHKTYINSSSSFTSYYLTDANPTIEYRYRDLDCNDTNASLYVELNARKIHWYNLLVPSSSVVGRARASGINDSNANLWYGMTYNDVDCSSSSEINSEFAFSGDENYSIFFDYEISASSPIHNDYGEWLILSR